MRIFSFIDSSGCEYRIDMNNLDSIKITHMPTVIFKYPIFRIISKSQLNNTANHFLINNELRDFIIRILKNKAFL